MSLAMALVGGIIVGEWDWLGQRRWGLWLGDLRVCARGQLRLPETLCLCTYSGETEGIFPSRERAG